MSVSKNIKVNKIAKVAFMPVSELELGDLVATCKFVQVICGDHFSRDQLFFTTLHDTGQNFFTLPPSAKTNYRLMKNLPQKISVVLKYYDPSWRPVDLSKPINSKSGELFVSKVSLWSRTKQNTSFLNEEVLVIRKKHDWKVSLQTLSESLERMLSNEVATNIMFMIKDLLAREISKELQEPDPYEMNGFRNYQDARHIALREIKKDIVRHINEGIILVQEDSTHLSNENSNKQDLFDYLKAEELDLNKAKNKTRLLINSLPKPRFGERSIEIDELLLLERVLQDLSNHQQPFAVLLDEQFMKGLSLIAQKCRSGEVSAYRNASFGILEKYVPNESIGHSIINSMRKAGERRGYLVPYNKFNKKRFDSNLWDKTDAELWNAFWNDTEFILQVITRWLEQINYSVTAHSLGGDCQNKLRLQEACHGGFALPPNDSLFFFIMIGRLNNLIPNASNILNKYTNLTIAVSSAIKAMHWRKRVEEAKPSFEEANKERIKKATRRHEKDKKNAINEIEAIRERNPALSFTKCRELAGKNLDIKQRTIERRVKKSDCPSFN